MFGHHHEHGRHRCRSDRRRGFGREARSDHAAFEEDDDAFGEDRHERPDIEAVREAKLRWRAMFGGDRHGPRERFMR